MTNQPAPLILLLALCITPLGSAAPLQEAEGEPPGTAAEAPHDVPELARLPAPLDALSGNILDLEKSGYFTVKAVQFQAAAEQFGSEDAIVWTLQARRPITYRHVLRLLRDFRDVRFYETARDRMIEIHWTLLYYPPWLDVGAPSRQVLPVNGEVQVWINLRPTDVRKIRGQEADIFVLRRPNRI